MNYITFVATNLAKHRAEPGDIITLTVRNEESDDGMYSQAKRLSDMFLICYGFWPEHIAIHPDHLALIKKVGKTIDVTIPEEISLLLGKLIELVDLPRRIPLVEDGSLDLYTAVARYHFRKENVKDFTQAIFQQIMGEK